MKKPIQRAASMLLKAANDGQVKLVDSLASEIESLDFSKLKDLTPKQKQNLNKSKNTIKEIKELNNKLHETKNSLNGLTTYYETMLLSIDEFIILTSLNNENAFTNSSVYQVPNELVKELNIHKKKYNALNSKVTDYNTLKQKYSKLIIDVKKIENNITTAIKSVNDTSNKLNQLNSNIDKIKKE